MTRHRDRFATAVALVVLLPGIAHAYIHLAIEFGGQARRLHWSAPRPGWFAGTRTVPGVSLTAFQQEVERAFAAWEAVPTSSAAFTFAGFTAASPSEDDGLSVFGFDDAPGMDRVLGATSFLVDVLTGEIVEADVFFNTAVDWSVASNGEAGRFDLRSVATHEIGHFLGLGHSAIGETELRPDLTRRVLATGAVMFPISLGRGQVADRTLQPDDVAGASELYPTDAFTERTGVITGRVRLDGRGVFGAHVVAFSPSSGSLIGGFALGADGEFRIGGLAPGAHVLRVEPLDDGDLESFLSAPGVDIDFRPVFHPTLVIAPRGGGSASVDVAVQRK
jgi:hypothetical protein